MWLEEEKTELKMSSLWRYSYLLERHIYPEFGNIRIKDLTQEMVQEFAKEKRKTGSIKGSKPLSDSYVNSILILFLGMHAYAVQKQMCEAFPSAISKPGMKKSRYKILSVEEMTRLLSRADETTVPISTGIAITLYAGLRVGEVCALQWKNIDLEQGILSVCQTVQRVKKGSGIDGSYLRIDIPKTPSSMREIPIHPNLMKLLKERKEADGNLFVVTGTAQFMNPATYETQFHRLLKQAGVADVNYHALRHSFTKPLRIVR